MEYAAVTEWQKWSLLSSVLSVKPINCACISDFGFVMWVLLYLLDVNTLALLPHLAEKWWLVNWYHSYVCPVKAIICIIIRQFASMLGFLMQIGVYWAIIRFVAFLWYGINKHLHRIWSLSFHFSFDLYVFIWWLINFSFANIFGMRHEVLSCRYDISMHIIMAHIWIIDVDDAILHIHTCLQCLPMRKYIAWHAQAE